MRRRGALLAGALLLLGAAGVLLGRDGYLRVKALLAQRLIDRAFGEHLGDGRPHRPWSWADTYPIARLELERLGVRCRVLSGSSGTSLAFGVGHVDGTAAPNGSGNCVLAGHRDREFAFLQWVRSGDVLRLLTAGASREYVVDGAGVVESTDARALQATVDDRLTLVTCYPFGGLLRSPWRYVVTAARLDPITISSCAPSRPSNIYLKCEPARLYLARGPSGGRSDGNELSRDQVAPSWPERTPCGRARLPSARGGGRHRRG